MEYGGSNGVNRVLVKQIAIKRVASVLQNLQVSMAEQMVLNGLRKQQKEIKLSLLYDSHGSEIFEEITSLQEYYLFNEEVQLLKDKAVEIAEAITPGSLVVELGCRDARKTAPLLSAIQHVHGRCRYVGIDVSESVLNEARRSLAELVAGLEPSAIEFAHADFIKGLHQVKSCYPEQQLCLVWLGSSVGNLTREDAVKIFKDVFEAVGFTCQLLVSMDMWRNPETLYSAYNDKKGVTERFIKHSMQKALSCIGYAPDEDSVQSWCYDVEINKLLRRVEMYISFPQGLTLNKHQIQIRPRERILVEFSTKYSADDIKFVATKAYCQVPRCWGDRSDYTCQIFLPVSHALVQCWRDTDKLFAGILDWNSKPIDLRHPYIFYYGHVCVFTKIKMIANQEESELDTIFSRGIDPNVLDPSQCHSHPVIPSTWPSKEVVIDYVRKTRIWIQNEVAKGKMDTRVFSLVIEHERMHQETLTYMVVQDRKKSFENKTVAINNPQKDNMFSDILLHKISRPDISIEAGDVTLGQNPCDISTFIWDNESPPFHTKVSEPFLVAARPVSIKDYLAFIVSGGYKIRRFWKQEDCTFFSENGFVHPATWSLVGTEYYIHGPESIKHWTEVAEEAVYVSLAEAEAFCKWMGCRVMTEAQYHRILDCDKHGKKVLSMRGGGWEWTSTEFRPFPGFKPMPEYEEYSADFFDGKHYVLKGYSDVTHASMYRDSFRNFYQRQYRYVFSKFRCILSACDGYQSQLH
ncbi:hypothetical protein SUGI_0817940 [Cryptomeria japonica]|nr:hypothetical protein SUGI_0817940 [Cryptomeria japonica]